MAKSKKQEENKDYVEAFYKWIRHNRFFALIIIICSCFLVVYEFFDRLDIHPVEYIKNDFGCTSEKKSDSVKRLFTYGIKSGDDTFNRKFQNKLQGDSFSVAHIFDSCSCKIIFNYEVPTTIRKWNRAFFRDSRYWYDSFFVEVSVCGSDPANFDKKFRLDPTKKMEFTEEADKEFESAYTKFINENINEIYDSVKTLLHR